MTLFPVSRGELFLAWPDGTCMTLTSNEIHFFGPTSRTNSVENPGKHRKTHYMNLIEHLSTGRTFNLDNFDARLFRLDYWQVFFCQY